MNHMELREILPWYVNGTLTSRELHAVEAHLLDCKRCSREVDELKLLEAAFPSLDEDAPEPSRDLVQEALTNIDKLQSLGGWNPFSRIGALLDSMGAWLRPAILAPAAIALLALVSYQNFWQIPGLERAGLEAGASQDFSVTRLRGVVRGGSYQPVEIAPDSSFVGLSFLVQGAPSVARFRCELIREGTSSPIQVTTLAAAEEVTVPFLAAHLPAGNYRVLVKGEGLDSGQPPLAEFRFELKRK